MLSRVSFIPVSFLSVSVCIVPHLCSGVANLLITTAEPCVGITHGVVAHCASALFPQGYRSSFRAAIQKQPAQRPAWPRLRKAGRRSQRGPAVHFARRRLPVPEPSEPCR